MTESTPQNPSPPRAFAQGVGLVLQVVGVLMFFSSCCVCSFGWSRDGLMRPGQVSRLVEENPDLLTDQAPRFTEPARVGMMLTVIFSTVGGLGMAVFGLGLQSDTPRAAAGATTTVIVTLLVMLAAGAALWRGGAPWMTLIWHGVLTLLFALLTPMCVAAFLQVRRTPPPTELRTIDQAQLDELTRNRRHH